MQILIKPLRSLLFVISVFLLITAFPLSVWLLFNFQTLQGGILSLLGIVGPFWGMWLYYGHIQGNFARVNYGASGVIMICFFVLLVMAPSGRPPENGPLRHMYSNNGRFARFSPINIIPEIEQMSVMMNIMRQVDPYIDPDKADRLNTVTLEIYHEMRQDPDFDIGSVMGLAIRQPLQIPFDNGHYYFYVPESADMTQPLPVLVYLHGAGGPIKAYQWVWRDFAEENGFVILSPTYGFGAWPEEAGSTAVMRAIDHAAEHSGVQLDLDQVWLSGLSNGGLGTIYTATNYPDRFQGLILISPAMPSRIMYEPDGRFNTAWRDKPVLLIHGEQDLRMPMAYLNQHIGFMEAGGIDLQTKLYPTEDHFLFFAQRTELLNLTAEWINNQR